jgi:hypothetical protein
MFVLFCKLVFRLDDLIIGALNADPSNKKLSAGKSYVVFGKIDNTTIELSTIANGTGHLIFYCLGRH